MTHKEYLKRKEMIIEARALELKVDLSTAIDRLVLEAEINLLNDTATGFESELMPEFEKGGRAAIKALRKMADYKQNILEATLNKEI